MKMEVGGEEPIYVLQVTEEANNGGVLLPLPAFVLGGPVNVNNTQPIETIILSDSDERAARRNVALSKEERAEMRRKKALENAEKKRRIQEAADRKRIRDGAAYSSVQGVFNEYPGLFTFFQKGKFEKSLQQKVLCKACNIAVHFSDLRNHSALPIHQSYHRTPTVLTYSQPPDIQSIMENNKGIFSNIVSTRKNPSVDCELCVYCNPCQKKINKKALLRHLAVEEHLQATIRFMTCEADFSAVAETLTDKTFSIYGNDLFCNPCRVIIPDTLRSIRVHIKNVQHNEARRKHEVGRVLSDFGNVISLKGKSNQRVLWCNKCDVSIIDGYDNARKHIEGSTHTGLMATQKERYIGDEEFNQDLAEMFTENRISFQKIGKMRIFLEKYTNRVMPDSSVLRQAMNNKRKARVKDDSDAATADAAAASDSDDNREMTVFKEVYEEDESEGEDQDEEEEVVMEEVVDNEEIEVEVVQFPAVTSPETPGFEEIEEY